MSIVLEAPKEVRVRDGTAKEGALLWHPANGELVARTVDRIAVDNNPFGGGRIWVVTDCQLVDPYDLFVSRVAALHHHKQVLENQLLAEGMRLSQTRVHLERVRQELLADSPETESPDTQRKESHEADD